MQSRPLPAGSLFFQSALLQAARPGPVCTSNPSQNCAREQPAPTPTAWRSLLSSSPTDEAVEGSRGWGGAPHRPFEEVDIGLVTPPERPPTSPRSPGPARLVARPMLGTCASGPQARRYGEAKEIACEGDLVESGGIGGAY